MNSRTTPFAPGALASRINLGRIHRKDALAAMLELYRRDPHFCIPGQAREILARKGRQARFILLGTKTFAEVFIRATRDEGWALAVVDDFKCRGGEKYHGVDIIPTRQFLGMVKGDPDIIAINCCRTDYSRRFFDRLCSREGIAHLNHEQVTRLFDMNDRVDYRTADWAPVISSRFEEFQLLEGRLEDPHSVDTLHSVLMFHLSCNPEWYLTVARPYSTLYFRSGLLDFSDNERFVDCGASIGESTTGLLGITGDRMEHSWMIEPDRFNLDVLRKLQSSYAGTDLESRISLHPFAVGDSDAQVPFHHLGGHGSSIAVSPDATLESVSVRRIDDIIDAPPTFIKMDIEGFEIPALRGARGAIRSGLPKMAISAYHRATDLLEIPALVDAISPGYSIGLQHHTEDRWDTCLYFYR
ncbi:methyltransferase, FkbM family [Paracidovorax cattleyae]|uniref:Methyltransferase, FkbM family n=3 Tax=Paracidovorax cattleyae TaxID=80868 RepID=A0A1H0TQC6_9BURK|nr:FkbM family methyltransferase [Paracidovorax cattleyae]SDP56272.1 methyltransferase, FkbM family [Paracidovorax cattleyae]